MVHKSTKGTSGNPAIELVLGDCLAHLKRMQPDSIHLVVTDPPYFLDGLDTDWKKDKPPKKKGVVGGLPVGMKFDPKQGLRLQDFIRQFGDAVIKVMKPGAFAVVFSQPRLSHRMAVGLEDAGLEVRDLFAWHFTGKAQFKAFSMDHFVHRMNHNERVKNRMLKALDGRKTPQLRPQFESMILLQKPKAGTHIDNWMAHKTGLIDPEAKLNGNAPSTVMEVEKPKRERYNGHLTVKPVSLVEHLIQLFSLPNQIVLDPFLGSGTTAVACKNTSRSCVGIEIREDYLKIAKQRLREKNVT